jgi:hypothetical protein
MRVMLQVATIPSSHPLMGGKAFTCAVVLSSDARGEAAAVPHLAIGSSDGTIRVLNGFKADSLSVVFGTKGTSAVSAMAVAPLRGRELLVTGVLQETVLDQSTEQIPASTGMLSKPSCLWIH